MDVPELSYGQNPRLPSASVGIDLQFSPERGRYFVDTQDLKPGNTWTFVQVRSKELI